MRSAQFGGDKPSAFRGNQGLVTATVIKAELDPDSGQYTLTVRLRGGRVMRGVRISAQGDGKYASSRPKLPAVGAKGLIGFPENDRNVRDAMWLATYDEYIFGTSPNAPSDEYKLTASGFAKALTQKGTLTMMTPSGDRLVMGSGDSERGGYPFNYRKESGGEAAGHTRQSVPDARIHKVGQPGFLFWNGVEEGHLVDLLFKDSEVPTHVSDSSAGSRGHAKGGELGAHFWRKARSGAFKLEDSYSYDFAERKPGSSIFRYQQFSQAEGQISLWEHYFKVVGKTGWHIGIGDSNKGAWHHEGFVSGGVLGRVGYYSSGLSSEPAAYLASGAAQILLVSTKEEPVLAKLEVGHARINLDHRKVKASLEAAQTKVELEGRSDKISLQAAEVRLGRNAGSPIALAPEVDSEITALWSAIRSLELRVATTETVKFPAYTPGTPSSHSPETVGSKAVFAVKDLTRVAVPSKPPEPDARVPQTKLALPVSPPAPSDIPAAEDK